MGSSVLDGQTQIRGKCQYWRERMDEYERWDPDIKCPERDHCRYHIPMY